MTPIKSVQRSWLGPVLALGLVVRLAAFLWNTRLFGDVNLYALVARQWRENGLLDYPGKFDFFEPAPYLTLSSPVTQHPAGWSWLAGLVASSGLGVDEFAALKLLCLGFGLAVIALGMGIARELGGPRVAIGAGLVLALHPMLIDYSANGSPYIAVAAAALALAYAVLATNRPTWLRGALAGGGAAAAMNFHGMGLLLLPAGLAGLALTTAPAARLRVLAGYVLAAALPLVPLFMWNEARFGQLLHSTSTFYVQGKLGLVRLVEDASGIRYAVGTLGFRQLGPYLLLALQSSSKFILHLGLETGFAGLLLASLGGIAVSKNVSRARAAGAAFVVLAILAPCLGWPEFKYRFLIPTLPFIIVLAVIGVTTVRPRQVRILGAASVAGCIGFWVVQIALTGSPAKYYAYDLKHRGDYLQMREAAAFLATQPPGVVLSFSTPLDGGAEAVWWHHHPAVMARGFSDAKLRRMSADFKPTFLLLSPDRRDRVAEIAPGATPVFENSRYLVFSLPAAPRG